MKRSLAFWIASVCLVFALPAQTFTTLNGVIYPGSSCFCMDTAASKSAIWADAGYTLSDFQSGPLNFDFEIALGSNIPSGHGMAFVIQQEGTQAIGTSNFGLGYGGKSAIQPSVAIEIDTRYNNHDASSVNADHLAAYFNGAVLGPAAAGPVILPNMEDGAYHQVQISWTYNQTDPANSSLTMILDNNYTLTVNFDPASLFNATGTIYYGWTGATTTSQPNEHKVAFAAAGSPGSCSQALGTFPVELLSFSGEYNRDHVELSWLTGQELNNDFFEVERSVDGQEWQSLGTVRGAGSSSSYHAYHFDDYLASYNVNYYRLRQVDFDGTFSYSDQIQVNLPIPLQTQLSVYPNPASEMLNVRLRTETSLEHSRYTIYDMAGRVIAQVNELNLQPNQTEFQVPVAQYRAGLYVIEVRVGKELHSQRFIVQ